MRLARRQFLYLAAGTAFPSAAHALDYPARQIRIVVGYPPGLAPDIVARVAGQCMSERLGQAVVIDNRPGAGTNLATDIVAKSAPDGHTLLMIVSTNAINATLYQKLNFDFARDIVPVACVGSSPFVMVVSPTFPAKTVPELVVYAKANPDKVNMASGGMGSGPHVAGEMFKMMTGARWTHVPYRTNYLPDLLAGQVQLAIPPIPQVIEFIKDGRLRALAVTTPVRSDLQPDVPAVAEFVPGYSATGWFGIAAPSGTAAEIIAKLNTALALGATDPKFRSRLIAMGVEPRPMPPAEFAAFVTSEIDKLAKVVKFADMKID